MADLVVAVALKVDSCQAVDDVFEKFQIPVIEHFDAVE